MKRGSEYVIYHAPLGGYIEKAGGMNIGHADPDKATRFPTRSAASDAKPGHSREMGGAGYVGRILPLSRARTAYRCGYSI